MITPIKTMTISQIIARQDDLLVSADDVKAIAKNEREKVIDIIIDHAYESESGFLTVRKGFLIDLKEQK